MQKLKFLCQKENHNEIIGICLNDRCTEPACQICLKCAQENHRECKSDIFQLLIVHKPIQQVIESFDDEEQQAILEFEEYKQQFDKRIKQIKYNKEKFQGYSRSAQNQDFSAIINNVSEIKQFYCKLKSKIFNKPLYKGLRLLKAQQWQEAADILKFDTSEKDYEIGLFLKNLSLAQLNIFSEEAKYIEKAEFLRENQIKVLRENYSYFQNNKNGVDFHLILNGVILEYEKKHEAAIQEFDNFLKIENSNLYCLYKKCLNLIFIKNFDQAQKCIGQIATINQKYYLKYMVEGYLLQKQMQYKQAIDAYDKALQINSKYSSPYYQKGKMLLFLFNNKKAIELLEKTIQLDSNNFKAYIYLGNALENESKFEEALSCYEQAISIKKDHLNAYYRKGCVLIQLKEYESANKCFDEIIAKDPNNYEAYYEKGLNLKSRNQYEEAILSFDEAYKIRAKENKYDKSSLSNVGICLYNLQIYFEAIQIFDKVIQIDSKDKEIHYLKGLSLQNVQNDTQAIQCFQVLINLDKQYQKVQYQKGLSHLNLKQYNEAIECFKEAFAQNKKHKEAYYQLGIALKKLKKYLDAVAFFEQVIQMDNRYINAIIEKGYSLRKLQNFEVAVQALDQAINSQLQNHQYGFSFKKQIFDSQFVKVFFRKGLTLLTLKRYKDAQESFQQSSQIDPKFILAITYEGISLCKQEMFQEGIKCFKKVLQNEPKNIMAIFLTEIYTKQQYVNIQQLKFLSFTLFPKQKTEQIQQYQNELMQTLDQFNFSNLEYLDKLILILKKLVKKL